MSQEIVKSSPVWGRLHKTLRAAAVAWLALCAVGAVWIHIDRWSSAMRALARSREIREPEPPRPDAWLVPVIDAATNERVGRPPETIVEDWRAGRIYPIKGETYTVRLGDGRYWRTTADQLSPGLFDNGAEFVSNIEANPTPKAQTRGRADEERLAREYTEESWSESIPVFLLGLVPLASLLAGRRWWRWLRAPETEQTP